jgi:uncharacterized membrane protein HdeD (DUF308 family)
MSMNKLDYRIEGRINRNVLTGILFLILGIVAIIFPFKFTRGLVYLAGAVMLGAGIIVGFAFFLGQGKSKTMLLKSIVLMIFGFISLMCPILGAKIFVGILMLFFFFAAITNFILAKSIKGQPGYKSAIITGSLFLILDLILIFGWQLTTQFFMGIFLGVLFITDGLVFIRIGKVKR